jgi:hypothetical protein
VHGDAAVSWYGCDVLNSGLPDFEKVGAEQLTVSPTVLL